MNRPIVKIDDFVQVERRYAYKVWKSNAAMVYALPQLWQYVEDMTVVSPYHSGNDSSEITARLTFDIQVLDITAVFRNYSKLKGELYVGGQMRFYLREDSIDFYGPLAGFSTVYAGYTIGYDKAEKSVYVCNLISDEMKREYLPRTRDVYGAKRVVDIMRQQEYGDAIGYRVLRLAQVENRA